MSQSLGLRRGRGMRMNCRLCVIQIRLNVQIFDRNYLYAEDEQQGTVGMREERCITDKCLSQHQRASLKLSFFSICNVEICTWKVPKCVKSIMYSKMC
jgi:hypothetical protein